MTVKQTPLTAEELEYRDLDLSKFAGKPVDKMRFEEELGIAQVSEILGIPEGTVKSRLHRLLNHLKQQLHDYE